MSFVFFGGTFSAIKHVIYFLYILSIYFSKFLYHVDSFKFVDGNVGRTASFINIVDLAGTIFAYGMCYTEFVSAQVNLNFAYCLEVFVYILDMYFQFHIEQVCLLGGWIHYFYMFIQ